MTMQMVQLLLEVIDVQMGRCESCQCRHHSSATPASVCAHRAWQCTTEKQGRL